MGAKIASQKALKKITKLADRKDEANAVKAGNQWFQKRAARGGTSRQNQVSAAEGYAQKRGDITERVKRATSTTSNGKMLK